MQNPFSLVVRALALWGSGDVHFAKTRELESIRDDAEMFIPFRKVSVGVRGDNRSQPGAVFEVRFQFRNLPIAVNRLLSRIPIPMIVAQPGFRSKTWLLGQRTGSFMGYYEFDTVADAEAYWDSLPLRMMRKRAREETLTHSVRSI